MFVTGGFAVVGFVVFVIGGFIKGGFVVFVVGGFVAGGLVADGFAVEGLGPDSFNDVVFLSWKLLFD